MLINLHSYFSLRYGTMSLDELIAALLEHGYETAVLTDINNSTGVLDFVRKGWEQGIRPLAGMEFRKGDQLYYIGIAKNEVGFQELNEWMTQINSGAQSLSEIAPAFDNVYIIYPFRGFQQRPLSDQDYIGVAPTDLHRLNVTGWAPKDRYVIWTPVSFAPSDYTLHRQLSAIDHNILISQLEPQQVAAETHTMMSRAALLQVYASFPHLIRNTSKLLAQCSFDFDFKQRKNKQRFTDSAYEDQQLLAKYAMEGFVQRYTKEDTQALERVKKELEIINNCNFSSYFLITDDICRYARRQGYHYVGRGSGANSIIAYCLGITEVCPIELDLYFERFLNPKRSSSPDFDVDFCWNERDDVYAYIFDTYGQGHVALLGAMSTFQGRSSIREMGKIFGLPKADIDRMVHNPADLLNRNEVTDMILAVCDRLVDFPNQRTIHSSGVLISERPLTCYSAIDFPPKGLPTVQYDMYVAEDIGFEKFDILSQRGIGHIKDCRTLIAENRQEVVDTSHPRRFFDDPKIADQLRSADTIGCFYIESPAMRQLLTKLRCDDYLTLVAASSIIRPGVASSGMMNAYIERHQDASKVQYLHPVLKEQLQETYGVMVYQEDVMKVGHHYGGLDLADADVLRRMMSGKYRHAKHLEEIEVKYFTHCAQMGYPAAMSSEIWRQMESFAGYSFSKAHSASFAVESYQSLYLKTYYPKEFIVAVLNNYGGFYSRKVYVNEAKKTGATVCLPCVNKSAYQTRIYGDDIYLGFDGMLHMEEQLSHRIAAQRSAQGDYRSMEDFVRRTGLRLEQLLLLVRVGAFRFTGIGKKELLWQAHLLLVGQQVQEVGSVSLFDTMAEPPVLPPLETSALEDVYDELELMGFPVSDSMFSLAKSDYRGDVMARELLQAAGRVVRMVGDFVADKRVLTKQQQQMRFGTFFDAEGAFFDTVHFPPSLQQYPLRGAGLYLIEGKVVVSFGCPSIEVYRCGKMPLKVDPRSE